MARGPKIGSPKTGGRQKGTKNKRTIQSLNRAETVLQVLDKHIIKDIPRMTPMGRASLFSDLLEYTIPKKARITEDGESVSEISVTIKRTRK